jgi:antitoxin component YwqK of YwqJK toxin-antitoxin module
MLALFTISTVKAQTEFDRYKVNGESIVAELYHDNGVLAQTGSYTLDGKLHGKWISYDRNGNKTSEAYYHNGMKTDTWIFYQGDIIKEVRYVNSKIYEVKTWKVSDTNKV